MKKNVWLGVGGAVALGWLGYMSLGWTCDVRSNYRELWFLDFRNRIEVDLDKDGRMDYAERVEMPFLKRFTHDIWRFHRQKEDGIYEVVFEIEARPVAFVDFYKDRWLSILIRIGKPFHEQYICYQYAPEIMKDPKNPYFPISDMAACEERVPDWTLSENPYDYPGITPPVRKYIWVYEQTLFLDFVENGIPSAYANLSKDAFIETWCKSVRRMAEYRSYSKLRKLNDEEMRNVVLYGLSLTKDGSSE